LARDIILNEVTVRFAPCLAVLTMLFVAPAARAQTAAPPSADQAAWTRKVQVHLLNHVNKSKPATRAVFQKAKSAGITGEVRVAISFVVVRNGQIESTRVAQSSGNAAIDSIAEQLVARAGPVPAMPTAIADERQAFTLPVAFRERTPAPAK
jgi:periplasmic protein TonB